MKNSIIRSIEELENRQNPPKPATVVFEGTFEHEEALKAQEQNPDLQVVVITTKDCSKKTEDEMNKSLLSRIEKLETAKVIAIQSGVFIYDPLIPGDFERLKKEMQEAGAKGLVVPRFKTIQQWEDMAREHSLNGSK